MLKMKLRIDIDTQTFVRFWLVVIGFAFAILAIYSAKTPLILLGIAFFLALALNTPVSLIARHLPGKSRIGGTAIAYVIVVFVLGIFAFLVIPPIVEQTAKFLATVPGLISSVTTQWHGLSDLIARYDLQPQVDEIINAAKESTTSWAAQAGQSIISGVGSLFAAVVSTFLVLVLSFLMLIEGPMWLDRIWNVYNDEDRMKSHRRLAGRMYSVVTGYITGQLTVSAIGATMSGLVVFILSFLFNVPANLTLPTIAIAFILSLVPMFGATIGGIIIALLLSFNDPFAAIVFIVFFVIYQQIENNFISPTIQARKVELSALVVLASVTTGVYVFGIAGGIISIPVAGCVKVLLEDYLEKAKHRRERSEKPMAKLVKKLKGEEA